MLQHLGALGVKEAQAHTARPKEGRFPVGPHPHPQGGLLQRLPKEGLHLEIRYMLLALAQQCHAAGDAVEVPIVLVLQVAAGAKAVDFHRQQVLPRRHVGGDVKLGVQLAVLGEAHLLAVDAQSKGCLHAAKAQKHSLALPPGGQPEPLVVADGEVFLGHGRGGKVKAAGGHFHLKALVWALPVEGVLHVGVHGLAHAVHLPAGGHRHGGQSGKLLPGGGSPAGGDVLRRRVSHKGPKAIQGQNHLGLGNVPGFRLLECLIAAKGRVGLPAVYGTDNLSLSHRDQLLSCENPPRQGGRLAFIIAHGGPNRHKKKEDLSQIFFSLYQKIAGPRRGQPV